MTPPPEAVVLASRGSRLALRQAEIVRSQLLAAHPGTEVVIRAVTTTGDRDRRPFSAIGGKGLFVGDVEREVVEGRADLAVHSAKDLTAELAPGCALLCVPQRASPVDVLVGGEGSTGEERLASLPSGAAVGTSSMRRRVLLSEARPDVDVVELRGNLDTRLSKVRRGEVAAAVLAAAGLERLGEGDSAGALDSRRWVPAPAQGALAVEGLLEREDLAEMLQPLQDETAAREVACERAFSARLEGGCSIPLGCLARVQESHLVVTGFLGDPSGTTCLRDRISGPAQRAEELGRELADALLSSGGDEIMLEVRDSALPQPSPP